MEYESLTDIYHLNSEVPEFQTCHPLRNAQSLQSRLCPPAHSVLTILSDRTRCSPNSTTCWWTVWIPLNIHQLLHKTVLIHRDFWEQWVQFTSNRSDWFSLILLSLILSSPHCGNVSNVCWVMRVNLSHCAWGIAIMLQVFNKAVKSCFSHEKPRWLMGSL